MSEVVHLKWGEQPSEPMHLMVTRLGRTRGEDFYVRPCDGLRPNAPLGERPAFASLKSALREAEAVAETYGVRTIYVRFP